MTSPLLGEFLGTMVLILLGNGAVAAVLLKGSKAEGSGWIVITAGWAFAVMAGVFTAIACGSSDAHLNPAVTLGFAVRVGDFSKFAPYLVGSLVWGIGLSLGGTTGYAINPARDLGPRIAHALLPVAGKTSSDWGYAPIPVLGPLVGGTLAGVALRVIGV